MEIKIKDHHLFKQLKQKKNQALDQSLRFTENLETTRFRKERAVLEMNKGEYINKAVSYKNITTVNKKNNARNYELFCEKFPDTSYTGDMVFAKNEFINEFKNNLQTECKYDSQGNDNSELLQRTISHNKLDLKDNSSEKTIQVEINYNSNIKSDNLQRDIHFDLQCEDSNNLQQSSMENKLQLCQSSVNDFENLRKKSEKIPNKYLRQSLVGENKFINEDESKYDCVYSNLRYQIRVNNSEHASKYNQLPFSREYINVSEVTQFQGQNESILQNKNGQKVLLSTETREMRQVSNSQDETRLEINHFLQKEGLQYTKYGKESQNYQSGTNHKRNIAEKRSDNKFKLPHKLHYESQRNKLDSIENMGITCCCLDMPILYELKYISFSDSQIPNFIQNFMRFEYATKCKNWGIQCKIIRKKRKYNYPHNSEYKYFQSESSSGSKHKPHSFSAEYTIQVHTDSEEKQLYRNIRNKNIVLIFDCLEQKKIRNVFEFYSHDEDLECLHYKHNSVQISELDYYLPRSFDADNNHLEKSLGKRRQKHQNYMRKEDEKFEASSNSQVKELRLQPWHDYKLYLWSYSENGMRLRSSSSIGCDHKKEVLISRNEVGNIVNQLPKLDKKYLLQKNKILSDEFYCESESKLHQNWITEPSYEFYNDKIHTEHKYSMEQLALNISITNETSENADKYSKQNQTNIYGMNQRGDICEISGSETIGNQKIEKIVDMRALKPNLSLVLRSSNKHCYDEIEMWNDTNSVQAFKQKDINLKQQQRNQFNTSQMYESDGDFSNKKLSTCSKAIYKDSYNIKREQQDSYDINKNHFKRKQMIKIPKSAKLCLDRQNNIRLRKNLSSVKQKKSEMNRTKHMTNVSISHTIDLEEKKSKSPKPAGECIYIRRDVESEKNFRPLKLLTTKSKYFERATELQSCRKSYKKKQSKKEYDKHKNNYFNSDNQLQLKTDDSKIPYSMKSSSAVKYSSQKEGKSAESVLNQNINRHAIVDSSDIDSSDSNISAYTESEYDELESQTSLRKYSSKYTCSNGLGSKCRVSRYKTYSNIKLLNNNKTSRETCYSEVLENHSKPNSKESNTDILSNGTVATNSTVMKKKMPRSMCLKISDKTMAPMVMLASLSYYTQKQELINAVLVSPKYGLRSPILCPIITCRQYLLVSDFNKHITKDHCQICNENIEPCETFLLKLDCRNIKRNEIVCLKIYNVRNKLIGVQLKERIDCIPLLIMCSRILTEDIISTLTLCNLPFESREYFVMWITGLLPDNVKIPFSTLIWNIFSPGLEEWYLFGNIYPIRGAQNGIAAFESGRAIILPIENVIQITNNYEDPINFHMILK